jgi:lysyl-tRNA synthetase class 2
MLFKRVMGKASFAKLQDSSGQIQVYLQAEALAAAYDEFKGWDVGDIVAAQGVLMRTRAGELSVRAESVRLLVKALRPLPDKWHGLADTEARYRQRYVDLIINSEARQVFETRTRIVRFLRDFLDAQGFLEVETPMMQPIPGGAVARPFVTHHNALGQDMYLRIAPELYLKRLVVGGFERVYEINRNFRNEGLSTQHNPEFTMLELYQAYADCADFMGLVERMMQGLAFAVASSRSITYQGRAIDFATPFAKQSVEEAIAEANPDLERAAPARCVIPAARLRETRHRACQRRWRRRAPARDLREDLRARTAAADVHPFLPDGSVAALAAARLGPFRDRSL